MAVDVISALETARQHLQDGAVQAADDLLAETLKTYTEQQQAAGALPPPGPRTPNTILIEFARVVAAKLGNPAELEKLINEFEAQG
jgi:hypothetical protein